MRPPFLGMHACRFLHAHASPRFPACPLPIAHDPPPPFLLLMHSPMLCVQPSRTRLPHRLMAPTPTHIPHPPHHPLGCHTILSCAPPPTVPPPPPPSHTPTHPPTPPGHFIVCGNEESFCTFVGYLRQCCGPSLPVPVVILHPHRPESLCGPGSASLGRVRWVKVRDSALLGTVGWAQGCRSAGARETCACAHAAALWGGSVCRWWV